MISGELKKSTDSTERGIEIKVERNVLVFCYVGRLVFSYITCY